MMHEQYATAPTADRGVREHFARVSAEFQAFLTLASAFYEHLRDCFAKWLQANRASRLSVEGAELPDAVAVNVARCRHSLHRCFVFLGDLARYRELHSQKAKKNFAAAESFYYKALEVIPENGNPHNQLAVLATYVEAETVAVYRYCRSLLIAHPFATAEENLALLFERSRQRPLAAPLPVGVSLTSTSPSKEKSSFLKSFLHRLTRMHGILFSLASRTANTSANNGAPPRSGALTYPRDMEALLFKDLSVLLNAGVVGDALLLKIVVTNIFCIIRTFTSDNQSLEDSILLAIQTSTVVMDYLIANISSKQRQAGSGSPEKFAAGMRLLGPISVFCDFLHCNSEYLKAVAKLHASQKTGNTINQGNTTPFVATFLENLATFLNHPTVKQLYLPLVSGMTDANQQSDLLREQQLMLKENIELRGFSPLESLLAGDSNWSGGSQSYSALPEAEAVKIRARNLYHFAKMLSSENFEGEPLLFVDAKGEFVIEYPISTATVASSNLPSQGFGSSQLLSYSAVLLGNSGIPKPSPPPPPPMPPQPQHQHQQQSADADDDFDDEVIVFQPSPALAAMNRNGASGGSMSFSEKSTFDSLSASEPFSLRSPSPPLSGANDGPDPLGSRFSGSGAIGSSIGYPSFHSFGDFSGFSGQGLLSGWGNGAGNGQAPVPTMGMSTGAFSSGTSMFPLDQGSGLFPLMDDLAAVERASTQYQREESSLSSILGSHSSRQSTGSIGAFSSASLSPVGARASARPPPGFSGMTPFGSQETDDASSGIEELSARAQPFFTRNPFINP